MPKRNHQSFVTEKIKHDYYEQRFNCLVCLEPKLDMVYGQCQHKLCTDCLYINKRLIRPNLLKCPICSRQNSFPQTMPDIPEDNIENQRSLGIMECPNKIRGCKQTFWPWDLKEHVQCCECRKLDRPGTPFCHRRKCQSTTRNPITLNLTPTTRLTRSHTLRGETVRRSPRLAKKNNN